MAKSHIFFVYVYRVGESILTFDSREEKHTKRAFILVSSLVYLSPLETWK